MDSIDGAAANDVVPDGDVEIRPIGPCHEPTDPAMQVLWIGAPGSPSVPEGAVIAESAGWTVPPDEVDE